MKRNQQGGKHDSRRQNDARRRCSASRPSPRAPLRFVGFSNVGLSFPFAAAIAKGFQRQAAKDAGVEAVVLDAKNEVQKQANDIDDLIAQRGQGHRASCRSMPTVAQGWVDKVAEAGIPVASVGSQIGDPNKRHHQGRLSQARRRRHPGRDRRRQSRGRARSDVAAEGSPRQDRNHRGASRIFRGQAAQRRLPRGARGGACANTDIVASQPGDWTAEKARRPARTSFRLIRTSTCSSIRPTTWSSAARAR